MFNHVNETAVLTEDKTTISMWLETSGRSKALSIINKNILTDTGGSDFDYSYSLPK